MYKQAKFPFFPFITGLLFILVGVPFVIYADDLLDPYESGDRAFDRFEIGDRIVYFHQREIGEATVEKDCIVYQFSKQDGELLKKIERWRTDLPSTLPTNLVSHIHAECLAPGDIEFSRLYYISTESDVFLLDPVPKNPCWVVISMEFGWKVVTIVDAVTGERLGEGVPPPYLGYSMTGPQYDQPCYGAWTEWMNNAHYWFEQMGYPTDTTVWPTKVEVQSVIQNPDVTVFYELAHSGGDSYQFINGCIDGQEYEITLATDVETWIANYRKMPFTFLGSCYSHCETGAGTISNAFRKGSLTDCVSLGYCGMAEEWCWDCWVVSLSWQDALFSYMYSGDAVKTAFDKALADYPICGGSNDCMRFAGDESFYVEIQSITATPTPTIVITPTPTDTLTSTPTGIPTDEPTPILTDTPTLTETPMPTETPSPVFTDLPTQSPTPTTPVEPTSTPTHPDIPTCTPTPTGVNLQFFLNDYDYNSGETMVWDIALYNHTETDYKVVAYLALWVAPDPAYYPSEDGTYVNFPDFGEDILPIGPFMLPSGFQLDRTTIFTLQFPDVDMTKLICQWLGAIVDNDTGDILDFETIDFFID